MATYPLDTIGISCPIQVDGVNITTSYAQGDVMSDISVGKGKAWFTMYDASGNIVHDASGRLLSDIYMNRGAVDGVAVYSIAPGIATPGVYTIQPFFAVNNSGGTLNWRKQAVITVTVSPLAYSTDTP